MYIYGIVSMVPLHRQSNFHFFNFLRLNKQTSTCTRFGTSILHFSLGGIAVFREFSQCSHTSFILAVAAGALCIAALAVVTAVTGNALFIKAGLVLGLFVARLSEAVPAPATVHWPRRDWKG